MLARNRRTAPRLSLAVAALSVAAAPLYAQDGDQEWVERCRSQSSRAAHCEVREYTLPASGPLEVDARPNGGVTLRGWDQDRVLVRARVQAHAPSVAEAGEIASRIAVRAENGRVATQGPGRMENGRGWSVSYEVFVPRRSDLRAVSENGGLTVHGVSGKLVLHTTNGGIALTDVGGNVSGRTTNGGVSVRLDGTRWVGEGLELTTTNGGVTVAVPETYSADLRVSTVNGGVSGDLAVSTSDRRGRAPRVVESRLGSGGAPLRISTTNGGVRISRR